jgi:hypothetical protein
VPDDDSFGRLECLDYPDVVGDHAYEAVVADLGRADGLPVAAHVHGGRLVARRRHGRQLVAPGVRRLRVPVDEQDQWTLALLDDVDRTVVQLDHSVMMTVLTHSFTTTFPVLRPVKSMLSASGAFSKPSTMCSKCLIFPSRSHEKIAA